MKRVLRFDSYAVAGFGVFLLTLLACWKSYVISHETIYLLGSRRVADPAFLAYDFTWSKLSPTTFLYDHLLAPLWRFLSEFEIVNSGRFVVWALTAWSLAHLARTLRLPAWSLAAGFAVWLGWKQTLADCGAPYEGLQVKSFAYPLVFFVLALVMRRAYRPAGVLAGLATAFHIVVGGWGFLAIAIGTMLSREHRTMRAVGSYLTAAALFLVPIVLATTFFVESGVTPGERDAIDGIYVTIAAPACAQPDEFMTPHRWLRATVVFALALVLVFAWPETPSRVLGGFIVALGLFFAGAEVAQRLELYSVLKLLPCQLGASLPALFLFVFAFGWGSMAIRGVLGRPRRKPPRGGSAAPDRPAGSGHPMAPQRVWAIAALGTAGLVWLAADRDVFSNLAGMPADFVEQVRSPRWGGPPDEPDNGTPALYAWIRANTPRDSVFVTPLIKDFWPYGERAQVASRRHPPFDRRLIEWTERLQAMNELDLEGDLVASEGDLTVEQLKALRERYGATHYLVRGERADLAAQRLAGIDGFSVYTLSGIDGASVAR